jgi:uncharacterized lipoprotein YddW (UPF0748 family)
LDLTGVSGYGNLSRGLCAVLMLGLTAGPCVAAGVAGLQPAPEIRAVWVHMEDRFSGDPQTGRMRVQQFVARVAGAKLNLILPWVRSEYVAALDDPRYRSSCPTARWDALGELIRAANAKGIAVHPWYSFTYYKSPASPEFDPKHGGDPTWAARRIDEFVPDPQTGKTVPRRMADCCPRHAEARVWQLKWIERLLDRYPGAGGFHVEEPGYGYPGNCVCNLCLREFQERYRKDLRECVDGAEAADFKCAGTTAFMDLLRARLSRRGRRLVLSVNGGCAMDQERSLGRDWGRWARDRWMDMYYAQDYTPDMQSFRRNGARVLSDLRGTVPVVIGIGIMWSGGRNTLETVMAQIQAAREMGSQGVALFSGEEIPEELWTALKQGPFRSPATLPAPMSHP